MIIKLIRIKEGYPPVDDFGNEDVLYQNVLVITSNPERMNEVANTLQDFFARWYEKTSENEEYWGETDWDYKVKDALNLYAKDNPDISFQILKNTDLIEVELEF